MDEKNNLENNNLDQNNHDNRNDYPYQDNRQYDFEEKTVTRRRFSFGTFILGVVAGAFVCGSVIGGYNYYLHRDDLRIVTFDHVQAAGNNTKSAGTDDSSQGGAAGKAAISGNGKKGSAVNNATLKKLMLLEETIDEYYMDADNVSRDTLRDGMYKGMLDSLGDPYSVYYTEEELNDLMQDTEGYYYGIGAYISRDEATGLPVIAGIIANSPAEEVGLMAGDVCYEVDGLSTEGMEQSEFVSKVKGPEGTTVVLTIMRKGEDDLMEVTIERRQVESPTVNYEMKEGKIGYIQITEFDTVTTDQFADALATLKGQGMKGLVIDLRNNPGGNLTTVCEIAEMLLPKGTIVYTIDRDGYKETYDCSGDNEFKLPMAVLVNEYSASASEILAGAIKDYQMGTLVGTTTYGKGIVQRIIPFSDGTAVKVTVSKYYTPNGINIHGTGIAPDVEIELDTESYSKDKTDNQLNKALSIVEDEIEN